MLDNGVGCRKSLLNLFDTVDVGAYSEVAMSKSIYITRGISDIAFSMLREKGFDVDVYAGQGVPTQRELIEALSKKPYDAVITLLTDKIDSSVFDACPSARLYCNYAVGYDNINLAAAHERGVVVANTPGDYSRSIAEHTLALMFALSSRLIEADGFVRSGRFQGWEPMLLLGTDLYGSVLGLVGTGRIGAQVAQLGKAIGMQVVYHDIARNEAMETSLQATYCQRVEEVLAQADVVSLHVPLLPTTQHLINQERLALMKPTALLMNTSRGAVIDEVALVQALQAKTIAGAGLDVFEHEPRLADGLAQLPNVVLTPHIASSRLGARQAMARIVAGNIIDFFETGHTTNAVSL